uniref:TBC1 domain family member 22A n=1 Tax=Rousettus aegyptiacus TaxID=9407 RepID=A0A7J8JMP5_ROUAE|nr:TBC1 domain family member 22A [Rousettus aegyptiacus]
MKVRMLEELVSRIDEHVHRHLERHEVRYLQFAFRWMNNLLTRELPLRCAVRLWDTYQLDPSTAPRGPASPPGSARSPYVLHPRHVLPAWIRGHPPALGTHLSSCPLDVCTWMPTGVFSRACGQNRVAISHRDTASRGLPAHRPPLGPGVSSHRAVDRYWSVACQEPGAQQEAEPEGFSRFHLYVCAAFLLSWRKEILEEGDFQELLLFLQNLPTAHWGDGDVSLLLAEAYRLKFAFADAPSHYKK